MLGAIYAYAAQGEQDEEPLRGALPNGLRYIVLARPSSRGELCARLVVEAGSLDENDDELGFGHLLQHLASERLTALAPPSLRDYLQQFPAGDSHTPAAFTHLTYGIDLSIGGAARSQETVSLLRQLAEGFVFSAKDVARAAAIVSKELDPAEHSLAAHAREMMTLLYRDDRLLSHAPQAVSGLAERATVERLQAFHRRTHSPGRMTVVLVGPVDARAAVEEIIQCFGSFVKKGEETSPLRAVVPPALQGPAPTIMVLPEAPAKFVAVEFVSVRSRPADTAEGRREELIQSVAMRGLADRLNRVAANRSTPTRYYQLEESFVTIGNPTLAGGRWSFDSTNPVFPASSGPSVVNGGFIPTPGADPSSDPFRFVTVPVYSVVQVTSSPATRGSAQAACSLAPGGRLVTNSAMLSARDGNWTALVTALETELRGLRTQGFAPTELAEIVAGLRSAARSAPPPFSEAIADDIATMAGEGRMWQTMAERLRVLASLQATLSEETKAAIAELFPPEALRVILHVAAKPEVDSPNVLAAYTKSASQALTPRAPSPSPAFRYESSSRPALARQTQVADLSLTLAAFDNGVRVNFRPAQFKEDRFRLRIAFPKSWTDSPPKMPALPHAAAYAFWHSSLNEQSQGQIDRLLAQHDIRCDFTFEYGNPSLLLDAPSAQIEFVFQLLRARFSDLDLADSEQSDVMADFRAVEQQVAVEPHLIALEDALRLYTNNDPRVVISPARHVPKEAISPQHISWLERHLIEAPLEIGIVGNLPPERVIAAAAATVGTLGARKPLPKSGGALKASKAAIRKQTVAPLPGNVGVTSVLWPVSLPDTLRQQTAVALASDILRERLTAVLRGGFGVATRPDISFHRDRVQRGFAFVGMTGYFSPSSIVQFTDASVRLANRLAEAGVTPDELARARNAAQTRAESDLYSDDWWLHNVLAFAQSRPEVCEAARQHRGDAATLTLEEVNQAARVFTSDRVVALTIRPSPPAASAKPKK